MAVEQGPVGTLAERFDAAGLATAHRFNPVVNGEKGSAVDHTDPANRHGPRGVRGNYGVYAGDGLVILDIDDYAEGPGGEGLAAVNDLPDTLTVETPHTDGENGGHRFYRIKPGDVYNTAKEACEDVWGANNPSASWGEVRAQNQYAVGPGSYIHDCKHGCCGPDDPGNYRIEDERPIETITADDLAGVLRFDPDRPAERNADRKPESTATTALGSPVRYDGDAAALVGRAIREFQNNAETTTRAFKCVMGLARGEYAEWGHENRSDAELDLASKIYGILRFTDNTGDTDNALRLIYSYITGACKDCPTTDGGQVRKWADRGDGYRCQTVEAAVNTFDQDKWDRWRLSKENPYQRTGDYGDPMYRYVLRAVQTVYEERPGYPSKDEVLGFAQGMNSERARNSHYQVLKRLQREREQVKLARIGRRYVYYPASAPDPPNASYYRLGGEKYYLR